MNRLLLFFITLLSCASCSNNKGMATNNVQAQTPPKGGMIAGPPTLIYKTRNNYNDKVPVLLSEDKKDIVSYPDPRDLKIADRFTYPTLLSQGYLLDNRGINKNVAFLKLSYEEYVALPAKPDRAALMNMILDNDPLTALYFCGSRKQYKEATIISQLNTIIDEQKITQQFERIK